MDDLEPLWSQKVPDDRGSTQVARNDIGLEVGPEASFLGPCRAYWHVELIDRFVMILTQRDTCHDLDESQNPTTIPTSLVDKLDIYLSVIFFRKILIFSVWFRFTRYMSNTNCGCPWSVTLILNFISNKIRLHCGPFFNLTGAYISTH